MHWNGSDWSATTRQIPGSNPGNGSASLEAVWGTGSENVYVAGPACLPEGPEDCLELDRQPVVNLAGSSWSHHGALGERTHGSLRRRLGGRLSLERRELVDADSRRLLFSLGQRPSRCVCPRHRRVRRTDRERAHRQRRTTLGWRRLVPGPRAGAGRTSFLGKWSVGYLRRRRLPDSSEIPRRSCTGMEISGWPWTLGLTPNLGQSASNDVFAIGSDAPGNYVIDHWDGTAWTPTSGGSTRLVGIWADKNVAFAIGDGILSRNPVKVGNVRL